MPRWGLYPEETQDDRVKCRAFVHSYRENRKAHLEIDPVKQKCLQFVHGYQFDADVEADRANFGLPSLAVDRTQGVYKTLDGWARRNRNDVQFVPLGEDDPEKAKTHNSVYQAIRTSKGLHSIQSQVYSLAAVVDEGFIHVFPEKNILGHLEPGYEVCDFQECYPDCNAKDALELKDAEFIDLPRYMTLPAIKRGYGRFMRPEFRAKFTAFNGLGLPEAGKTRNQSILMDDRDHRGEQVVVVTRYYKAYEEVRTLVDLETGEERPFAEDEADALSPEILETMGFAVREETRETIMRAVFVPAISEDEFLMDEPNDFQPLNAQTGKKYWPVARLPHQWIGGKAVGAIRTIIKLQEARNLILSALQHHIQTSANGGLLVERSAVKGDEMTKLEQDRAQAGITIVVEDGALEKKKIAPIPKGELAFQDGGTLFEQILQDAIRDVTGAEPVMRGQAQQGAPATLFKQQVEQSQNQMLGSAELFRDFQFLIADITMSFVRQFYTEERILQVEGKGGMFQTLIINQETPEGILNDVTQGLMTVRKTEVATTESARRQRLADNIELLKLMGELGLPSFLLDYETLIQDMDIPQDRKVQYQTSLAQWKQLNGLGAFAQGQADIAAAQNGMAPQPQPLAPVR